MIKTIINNLLFIFSVAVISLLTPTGKTLFHIGGENGFPVTQDALLLGLERALVLCAMVWISKLVSKFIFRSQEKKMANKSGSKGAQGGASSGGKKQGAGVFIQNIFLYLYFLSRFKFTPRKNPDGTKAKFSFSHFFDAIDNHLYTAYTGAQ
ncbi:MAG: hypothetical protein Ta2A_06780 [Treponemataceae bacterium]|nr:MAG: hypothetical protein Ta2A_06780 [Treponemataceae bacterium]